MIGLVGCNTVFENLLQILPPMTGNLEIIFNLYVIGRGAESTIPKKSITNFFPFSTFWSNEK
jgi:hypothetical protein